MNISVEIETWELERPFRIARGLRTHSDAVVVTVEDGGLVGRGEGMPIARYEVTAEEAAQQIKDAAKKITSRDDVQSALEPGAARNAVDCAFWDLECQREERDVWTLADVAQPNDLRTAMTLSIDTVSNMEAAAKLLNGARVGGQNRLIKIKLDDEKIKARVEAIRNAAPLADLVIDANESWSIDNVMDNAELLAAAKIQMLEQPLAAGKDEALVDYRGTVPLSADESAHVAADVDRLQSLYSIINIKLDKSGGLTEALKLRDEAKKAEMDVMVGCMICTSLSVAPAAVVAQAAKFVDLDGPTWLAQDRPGGFAFNQGRLPGSAALWGSGHPHEA